MHRRTGIAAALAVAAGLAVAPGAAHGASWLDPGERTYVPVPAGTIEHTVFAFDYEGELAARNGARTESFVTSDRSRNLVLEPDGTLSGEDATAGDEWLSWNREQNVLRIHKLKYPGRPVIPNQATRAAIYREQVDAGWLKVGERTTYAGRPALVLVDGPSEPVGEWHSERITVDASTYEELAATITSIGVADDGSRHESTVRRRLVVDEDLPLNDTTARQLEFGPHPDAAVKRVTGDDDRAHSARAKKKVKRKAAGKRRGGKAKRRAARSRRAAR